MTLRKITSLNMVFSFILLVLTSVVLYVVPEGRIAYWSDWDWLGLSKSQWGDLHIVFGTLFLIAGLIHLYLNWKPIVNYMRNRAREFRMFTPDFNVALVITVVVGLGTYFAVLPFQWLLDPNDSIIDAADWNRPAFAGRCSSRRPNPHTNRRPSRRTSWSRPRVAQRTSWMGTASLDWSPLIRAQ